MKVTPSSCSSKTLAFSSDCVQGWSKSIASRHVYTSYFLPPQVPQRFLSFVSYIFSFTISCAFHLIHRQYQSLHPSLANIITSHPYQLHSSNPPISYLPIPDLIPNYLSIHPSNPTPRHSLSNLPIPTTCENVKPHLPPLSHKPTPHNSYPCPAPPTQARPFTTRPDPRGL